MNETLGSVAPVASGGGEWPSPVESAVAELWYQWWLETRPAWVDPGWWEAPIRPEVRALLSVPLGLELMTDLGRLAPPAGHPQVCPADHRGQGFPWQPTPGGQAGFPCACQVVLATAWEAMASWTAARSAQALVAAAGAAPVAIPASGSAPGITDPAREELAPALRLSPASTGLRITAARGLAAQPELLSLVTDGVCSYWAARGVLAETANLPEPEAGQIQRTVAEQLRARNCSGRRAWTATEVRRAARAARLQVAGPADGAARTTAHSGRRVTISPAGDGMAALVAILAETDAHRIHARLTALASGLDDPERTTDQKRADILTDVLLTAGPAACQPHATRPEVSVVVSLATLLGLNDDPAEVPGLGPIPATTARELAADGLWQAWVTDASGQVTATGSRNYTPSAALARHIRAREPHCRMPGCRRRSVNCDLDHTIPYPNGLSTLDNLGPLCRRHHILKTHYRSDLVNEDDGWTWTTPAGITHHDGPGPPLDQPPPAESNWRTEP